MSIYRVTVKAEWDGSDDQFNVHHYEFPNYVPDDTELQEFVDNLGDLHETYVVPYCTSVITYNSIEVRRVDVGNLPSAELIPDNFPIAGTATGVSMPPQVAVMLRFSAPQAYPRSGRVYLPVMAASQLGSTGRTVAGLIAIMDTFGQALEEIAVTGQVDAQKVAVTYGGTPRVVTASNVLFQAPTRNIFQTQRRRTPGVGS